MVYRNIDDAFPLSIKDKTSHFQMDLELQKQAALNLNSDFTSKIGGLLFGITELNQSLMMMFRTAYVGYQTDPCNSHQFLLRQIEKINEEQHRLSILKSEIAGLIKIAEKAQNLETVFVVYQDIISRVPNINVSKAVVDQIIESTYFAKKWSGGVDE